MLLIVLGIVAFVAGTALAVRHTHPKRALPAPSGAQRGEVTLFNLEIGDVVEHLGRTYIVENRPTTTTRVAAGPNICS